MIIRWLFKFQIIYVILINNLWYFLLFIIWWKIRKRFRRLIEYCLLGDLISNNTKKRIKRVLLVLHKSSWEDTSYTIVLKIDDATLKLMIRSNLGSNFFFSFSCIFFNGSLKNRVRVYTGTSLKKPALGLHRSIP